MNNRLRLLLSTVMVFVLALGVAAPMLSTPQTASAQGPFDCPLTEEDCAILFGALEAAPTLTSVNIDSLSLALDYDFGEEAGNGSVKLEAYGPLMMVEGGTSPFVADLTISGDMVSPDETDSFNGQVIVIDDMTYSYDADEDTWTVEEVTADDMSGLDLSSMDLESVFTAINDLSAIEGVVVWERGDDMEGMAVFTVDIRLGELLVAPEFATMLAELAGDMGDESMDAESMGFIIGMIGAQIKPQLDESSFQMTFYINPEDNYIYGMNFLLDMDLDLSFLAAMAGDEMSIPPISLFTEVDLELSQHNEVFDIVAPDVEMAE